MRSRWVQEHSTPLHDDGGHVRVVQGVITDVTDRHRAEAAEARAEQVLREMLDAIPLAAVIEDMDGRIVYCNQHLAGVLGRRPEELLGRHWLEAVAPESTRDTRARLLRAAQPRRGDDDVGVGRAQPCTTASAGTAGGARR